VRTTLLLLFAFTAAAACMKAPDPAGMRSDGGTSGTRPVVDVPAPAEWRAMPPDQSFYLAKWELPEGAIASVSWLGAGSSTDFIVQNVQRWLGEWQGPGGEPVADYALVKEQNGGLTMHRIELEGTLTGTRQLGGGDPRPDWRLDGVVIESPRGPLFFKLIGPAAAVTAQRDAVWRVLAGVQIR
jgi:hypothetical protein